MLGLVSSLQAEISLSRLSYNLRLIQKRLAPGVVIMAVVKSNAYGHGLIPISRHLYSLGVGYFGVARLEEALEIRNVLPRARILILSPIPPENFSLALKNNITLTVTEKDQLKLLDSRSKKLKLKARIHLKVDTGLNRAGVEPEAVLPFAKLAASLPDVELEGIFTHFANASTDKGFTLKQLSALQTAVSNIKKHHLLPQYIHAAATAAIFNFPQSHFNLVRPGLALYGHFPDHGETFTLKPILSLTTRISRIHSVGKGETVGYDRTYKAKTNILAATLSAGYADGIRRAPKSWPHVSINNQVAPIIGRMSMDQTVIDISGIKPKPTLKTKVLLIDAKGGPVALESIAEKIGTSPYEVLTSLSENRICRSYIR